MIKTILGSRKMLQFKLEKGSGSKDGNPTCITCGNKQYGKCLMGTRNCFGCDKDGQKVSDCHTIETRGRKSKQVPPSSPNYDVPRKAFFYALQARGSKIDNDDDVGRLYLLSLVIMSSL